MSTWCTAIYLIVVPFYFNQPLVHMNMKSLILTSLAIVALSACSRNESPSPAPAASSAPVAAAQQVEMTPENLSNESWKNGVWIEKNGLNGFFMTGNASTAPKVGSHLTFAQSGDRIVTDVVVKAPYVNVYVNKPLDPVGDGFPNKVKQ